jgi:ABC-type antimicrobial peptide transport system permease subunit
MSGAQIFQKSRYHLKIPSARRVIWSKFHTEDSQILGSYIQNFPKSRYHLKIPIARRVIWSKFHTEDSQILGSYIQNEVAKATFLSGFVHPRYTLYKHLGR